MSVLALPLRECQTYTGYTRKIQGFHAGILVKRGGYLWYSWRKRIGKIPAKQEV
jgi:hypothetical protein